MTTDDLTPDPAVVPAAAAPLPRPGVDGRDPSTWPTEGTAYVYAADNADGSEGYLAKLALPCDHDDILQACGGGRYRLAFLRPGPSRTWSGGCYVTIEGPNLRAELAARLGTGATKRGGGVMEMWRQVVEAQAKPSASAAADPTLLALVGQLADGQARLAEAVAELRQGGAQSPTSMRDRVLDKLLEATIAKSLDPQPAREELDLERMVRMKKLWGELGGGSDDLQTVMGLLQGFMSPGGQGGAPPRQEKRRLPAASQQQPATTSGASQAATTPTNPPPHQATPGGTTAAAAGQAPATTTDTAAAGGSPPASATDEPDPAPESGNDAGVSDDDLHGILRAKGGIVAFEALQGIRAECGGQLDAQERAAAVEHVAVLATRLLDDSYLDQARQAPREMVAQFLLEQIKEAFPGNAETCGDARSKAFVLDVLGMMFDEDDGGGEQAAEVTA